MKKEGLLRKLTSFFLVFVMLLGIFIPTQTVFAEGDISNKVVTNLQVSPADIQDGGKTRVKVDFAENKNHNIQEGDIITITWTRQPDIQFSGFVSEWDLEIQGKIVGKVVIGQDKAVITFNEKINNLYDVEGFVSFEVEGRNFTQTSEEDTKLGIISSGDKNATVSITKPQSGNVGVFYYKTGNMDTNDTEHVNWWLNANMQKAYVDKEIRIEDEIQGGQELVNDSFQITVTGSSGGEYSSTQDFENRYDGSSIIVDQNKIKIRIPQKWASLNQFSIYYQTKIIAPKQEKFVNNSKAWYQEHGKDAVEGKDFNWAVDNINVNAGITGTVKGELKIIKNVEGTATPIKGVKFLLKNDAGTEFMDGQSEIILETNEDGIANIKGLPVGNYKVKEIEAPKWVDFDPLTVPELTFEIKDDDIEGKLLNVENKIVTTSISVEKKWVGPTGDSVVVQVKAEGSNNVVAEYELKANENWEHTFTGLDKYAPDGTLIKYKVVEKNVPNGYKVSYEKDPTGKWVITNTNVKKTEVSVKKKWIGAERDSVLVELRAEGSNDVIKEYELKKSEGWKYTFTGLDKYAADGTLIKYKVVEKNVPQGYTATYEQESDNFWIIKNTQDKTKVKVTKEWEDVTGNHPTIKLQLLKNGQNEGSPIELTNGTTTHTWTDLDKTDAQGNEYAYTVKEVGETANSIQLEGNWYKVSYGGNTQDGLIVTNKKLSSWTPMIPPTRDVKVTKVWNLLEGSNIPDTKIEVELYKDGEATGKKLELTKDNNWTGEFKNLEVADGLGSTNYYNYTVKEIGESTGAIKLDGKWFKVSYSGSMKNGFTITNQKEKPWTPMEPPIREVKVTKLWKEHSGNTITAPTDKITVELYKDGNPTGKTLELNASNNWNGVFKNLEVADGLGSTDYYKYTVKEVGEDGNAIKFDGKQYKVVYGGSIQDGLTITNEKEDPPTPPSTPPTPDKPTVPPNTEKPKIPNTNTNKTLPKTGDGTNLSLYACLLLTSGSLFVLLGIKRRKYAK
ncbi:Cna protein B-type domain-containing protein [Peptostreptococcaceae bacterium pGA-8]|nr:Cna protein B-type domain-containing protein [Peptostreptococcaceae bacterium pGA-8]